MSRNNTLRTDSMMIAEKFTKISTTQLVCYAVQAEPLESMISVSHDSSYVTQLLMGAVNLNNVPQRRRSDRTGPLAAYTSRPTQSGRTRRIA